jgi:hypothetical protein
MRNTFSWPCASCGEFNVIELGGQAGSRLRCAFCFHPVQALPSLQEETPMNAPPVILSDAWIGDSIVRPFFRSSAPLETTGRSARSPRRSRATPPRSVRATAPSR